MSKVRKKLELVEYNTGEKVLSTVSHAIAAVLVVISWFFLFKNSSNLVEQVGNTIYSICIFIMFFNSALYHGVPDSKFSYIMRAVDHSSIFLAIAGSYTPILLFGLGTKWAYLGLLVIWMGALSGIIMKIIAFSTQNVRKIEKASIAMYLIMGWFAVLFVPSLIRQLGWKMIGLILLGGIFYTIGVFFYKNKKIPLNHFIWHIFIILGSFTHFITIYILTVS